MNHWGQTKGTNKSSESSPDSTDSARKLDIFLHDCYSLRVDCAQIGVLE